MRDHHGLGLRGLHITGSGPATWPIPTAKRPDREEHWNHFHLAEQYFEELERSRAKRGEQRGDIIALSGSVEAAYALGVADGIVDLVGKFRIYSCLDGESADLGRIRRDNESSGVGGN